MGLLNNRNQWSIVALFSILTLALWAVIIFRFVGVTNVGSLISSIVIGVLLGISGLVSSRGLGWNLLTKISMRLGYDTIFAPGYRVATHWAISRLSHLLLFSIAILLMVDRSIISGQNWLVALTTATTIVSIEVLSEFVFSNDDRGIEIGPPYSYIYTGVSEKPRTVSEIQQSADDNFTEDSVRSYLKSLEDWNHVESKKVSGQQIWWKKQ